MQFTFAAARVLGQPAAPRFGKPRSALEGRSRDGAVSHRRPRALAVVRRLCWSRRRPRRGRDGISKFIIVGHVRKGGPRNPPPRMPSTMGAWYELVKIYACDPARLRLEQAGDRGSPWQPDRQKMSAASPAHRMRPVDIAVADGTTIAAIGPGLAAEGETYDAGAGGLRLRRADRDPYPSRQVAHHRLCCPLPGRPPGQPGDARSPR